MTLLSSIVKFDPILLAASPFIFLALVLSLHRVSTTWNYYYALRRLDGSRHGGQKIISPVVIPYTIPWLGHTLSFLNSSPGQYWSQLFSWHPRNTGICTLVVGGRKTHIVYSPPAVQAMFKAKSPSRDVFDRDLFHQVFLMSPEQIQNAEGGKHFEHEMNAKYMTNFERVNELTAHFTKVLDDVLQKDASEMVQMESAGLYEWLRDRLFTASCTALFGERLLEMYPEYCEDFFNFDNDFLKFFFRLPGFMMKDAIARRQRIFNKLEDWSLEMHRLGGGKPINPEGPAWEPLFGSRLNRARQLDYKNRKLTTRSGAALDAGLTFGLSSNVIPATGWMLFHLLSPGSREGLLPRVLTEIKEATKPDGSLDIATLVSQPVLQSVWTETLRMYTDVLVTRNLPEDIMLPLDEDGKTIVRLQKGDNLFAPSWLGHHDPAAWSTSTSSPEAFDAERFLTKDPKTGRDVFTLGKSTGKFLPFGGGKTICPGRIFAKQEALGALAMVLVRFDIEFLGFVDTDKQPTEAFPGFLPAFPGSGALAPGGDMRVKIRRRD